MLLVDEARLVVVHLLARARINSFDSPLSLVLETDKTMAKKLETTAGGWTAKRFTQKPLRQPTYDFRDVPKCSPDLAGSSLHFLTEREHLVEAMSEMVLLCIEAIRRHKGTGGRKRASKPLSLEYMADRLDVDDPMCGYMIRTNEKPPSGVGSDKWEMGMLQGFITITTFTNWQKSFRWDSMHDSAFAYDDEHLAEQMASGERRYDTDGSLAKALQATVRSGDPWDEGIVWPRIAEISLLGALGCGKVRTFGKSSVLQLFIVSSALLCDSSSSCRRWCR